MIRYGIVLIAVAVTGISAEFRSKRSLEGQTCDPANATSCSLAYTACDAETKTCRCDRAVSVGMQVSKFPEVIECIPLDYVTLTNRCLPTIPDMCSILHPGSVCDVSSRREGDTENKMTCACKEGGVFPNCTVKIGMICRENQTCSSAVRNSFCGNLGDGKIGECVCGADGGRTYVPSDDQASCRATNCAASPCRGDAGASECRDTQEGYVCSCRAKSKGRRHSFGQQGICCSASRVPCDDYSKCIEIDAICNGVTDCEDCSDELKSFCPNKAPVNDARCGTLTTTAPSTVSGSTLGITVAGVTDASSTDVVAVTDAETPNPPVGQMAPLGSQTAGNPGQVSFHLLPEGFGSFVSPFKPAAAINQMWNPFGGKK